MTVELTSALAGPIAALILKSWLGDTAAGIGDNLLALAFARLGDRSKARAAFQRAEKIARGTVEDLEAFFANEGVDAERLEVAAFDLGQTIRESVDAAFLVHQKLKVEDIERGLLAARPVNTIYGAAELEHSLYIRLVQALAPRLRVLGPELPGFRLERDAALLDGLAKIAGDTPRILSELHTVREEAASAALAIDELATRKDRERSQYGFIYRKLILNTLDYVEILGLDLEPDRRMVDLSIAYLSLTTNTAQLGKVDYETLVYMLPVLGSRLLIEGSAGSGKSTLLRWTAVQAAKIERNRKYIPKSPSYRNFLKSVKPKLNESYHYVDVYLSHIMNNNKKKIIMMNAKNTVIRSIAEEKNHYDISTTEEKRSIVSLLTV